jgi:hypothetical protein
MHYMAASTLFGLAFASVAAWATHVIWIIGKLASDGGATFGQIALGLIGAFMPPVGAIHGALIWFGFGF